VVERAAELGMACAFDLRLVAPKLPDWPVPPGYNEMTWLREVTWQGAARRYTSRTVNPKAYDQIAYELDMIDQLGFAGYFLVVWDIVEFCRRSDIYAQGRGSAANSAVCYALGITNADAVGLGLLFERFLSPERDGPPDIDVDIESDRREEAIQYVYERYGRENAAQVANVITYRPKSAVRDMGKAMGAATGQLDAWSKQIDHWGPLEATHDHDIPEPVMRLAHELQHFPRHLGIHSGGMVICDRPVVEVCPVEWGRMPGRTVLQWDKDDCAAVGLVKFDLLGLGMLSVLHYTVDLIREHHGVDLDLADIPQEDAVYDMLCAADSVGVFQVESRAQMATLPRLKPRKFYDIVVEVALIRPGPIQANFVHPYTARRRGLEPVTYLHPDLEPILKRTQGIPIFQEQAMAIAMKLGGYSAAQADELRRTMGHIRKVEKLHRVLEQLRARMVERGVEEPVAARIAEDLKSFANYGFPESHAWSFALIAYATGYLKAHYTAEFYAGLLNSYPMGFYPPSTLIHDARRHGLKVLPTCMRDGDWECTIEPTDNPDRPALRIGWRHIRGLGEKSLDALKAARGWDRFSSIDDVVQRAKLQRADALHLARAGAFGAWEPDRRRAAWVAMRAVGDSLPLAPARITPYNPRPLTRDELIFLDYFSVGISVDGHPMEHLREKLRQAGVLDSRQLEKLQGGESITTAGLVTIRQQPQSAKGTVFLLMEDEFGFINVIVSKRLVEEYSEVVKFSTFVAVQGKFERDGGVRNVIGKKFSELKVKQLVHASRDFH
jgi:error-prone DNA polymerase